jgi:hypothetical protein
MERELLKKAATALELKLADPDYLEELTNVEGQVRKRLTGPRATAAPGGGAAAAGPTRTRYDMNGNPIKD